MAKKRSVGRPAVPKNIRRDVVHAIRFSQSEAKTITTVCRKQKLTVSEMFRALVHSLATPD